jgi:hypothetical protein
MSTTFGPATYRLMNYGYDMKKTTEGNEVLNGVLEGDTIQMTPDFVIYNMGQYDASTNNNHFLANYHIPAGTSVWSVHFRVTVKSVSGIQKTVDLGDVVTFQLYNTSIRIFTGGYNVLTTNVGLAINNTYDFEFGYTSAGQGYFKSTPVGGSTSSWTFQRNISFTGSEPITFGSKGFRQNVSEIDLKHCYITVNNVETFRAVIGEERYDGPLVSNGCLVDYVDDGSATNLDAYLVTFNVPYEPFDFKTVSNPTIVNGVASGFQTSAKTKVYDTNPLYNFDNDITSMDLIFPLELPQSGNDQMIFGFYGSPDSSNDSTIGYKLANNKVALCLGNSSNYVIYSGTIPYNTKFWVKCSYNASIWTLYTSLDGNEWTTCGTYTYTSNNISLMKNQYIIFGNNVSATNRGFSSSYNFCGSIYLDSVQMKINGELVRYGCVGSGSELFTTDKQIILTKNSDFTLQGMIDKKKVGVVSIPEHDVYVLGNSEVLDFSYPFNALGTETSEYNFKHLGESGKMVIDGDILTFNQQLAVSNATISDYFILTPTTDCKLELNFGIVSEGNYDFGYVYVGSQLYEPTRDAIVNRTTDGHGSYIFCISGTNDSLQHTMDLEKNNTYYVIIGYTKDSSVDNGLDSIYLKSVNVVETTPSFILVNQ